MARKKRNNPTKTVSMSIDVELYEQSKILIPNRTQDYEDYLHRKIQAGNSLEFLKMEIEELDKKRENLKREYNIKQGLLKISNDNMLEATIDQAVKTVTNIILNENSIGINRLKEVADINNVIMVDLKKALPEELQSKIVKYHPVITRKVGTLR